MSTNDAADVQSIGTDDSNRPDDCACFPGQTGLPCWACYREHFETPHPNPDPANALEVEDE